MHEESGNANRAAKNNLPSFTFNKRIVRYVFMADLACGNIFECQQVDKILQVNCLAHVQRKAVKQTVVASLKTGKPHIVKFAQLIEKVEGHLSIKDTEVGKILFKWMTIPEFAVECRAFICAQDGHKIVD